MGGHRRDFPPHGFRARLAVAGGAGALRRGGPTGLPGDHGGVPGADFRGSEGPAELSDRPGGGAAGFPGQGPGDRALDGPASRLRRCRKEPDCLGSLPWTRPVQQPGPNNRCLEGGRLIPPLILRARTGPLCRPQRKATP